mmetsp:Transcript_9505/g.30067  ORF Transcript_9505/g.30067 Transcript_9505/m.30067 type:complete len:308 (-) Transcript_9505:362-1285(-)
MSTATPAKERDELQYSSIWIEQTSETSENGRKQRVAGKSRRRYAASIPDEAKLVAQHGDDLAARVLRHGQRLARDLLRQANVRLRDRLEECARQRRVERLPLLHPVLVEQDVRVGEVALQQLAELLLRLLDHTAVGAVRPPLPDAARVGRADLVHVNELPLPLSVGRVPKLKLCVDKDLVEARQRLADRLEALLQEALVHIDVRRRGEAKLCEVGGDVVSGDVDVVLLGHARDAGEDALGGGGHEQLGQLLVASQPVLQAESTECAAALCVVSPHRAGDVLAADGLNHHRLRALHNPHQRVRHLENV